MKRVLSLVALSLVLWGCGPEQPTKDKEDAQIAANENSSRSQLAPAVGVYRGTMTMKNGNVVDARLTLTAMDLNEANPGRSDFTVVPTLQGSLEICMGTACFDSGASETDINTIGQINSARFVTLSGGSGRLTGFYDAAQDASNKALSMTLDAVLTGNHLLGQVATSLHPEKATIDMQRVSKFP